MWDFSQAPFVSLLIAGTSALAPAGTLGYLKYWEGLDRVGLPNALVEGTMNQVSTWTSKPHLRGSHPFCLRQVAAAGSLLDYWTDFGRLLT